MNSLELVLLECHYEHYHHLFESDLLEGVFDKAIYKKLVSSTTNVLEKLAPDSLPKLKTIVSKTSRKLKVVLANANEENYQETAKKVKEIVEENVVDEITNLLFPIKNTKKGLFLKLIMLMFVYHLILDTLLIGLLGPVGNVITQVIVGPIFSQMAKWVAIRAGKGKSYETLTNAFTTFARSSLFIPIAMLKPLTMVGVTVGSFLVHLVTYLIQKHLGKSYPRAAIISAILLDTAFTMLYSFLVGKNIDQIRDFLQQSLGRTFVSR